MRSLRVILGSHRQATLVGLLWYQLPPSFFREAAPSFQIPILHPNSILEEEEEEE